MIRIEGRRGIGKTTKLLFIAADEKYTIIVPTIRHKINVEDMAVKYLGKDHDIKIITSYEFFSPYFRPEKDEKFLIDDLEYVLADRHVVGYSMTCEAKENIDGFDTCFEGNVR